MYVPSQALVPPDTRAAISAEVTRINKPARVSVRVARSSARCASARRSFWNVDRVVTTGAPLRDLLATVGKKRADLVVVGAKGTTGVRHLLLGSVAEGALNRSPVPIFIHDELA
jgi:nucleotide-binding universal stress UspA family protein